MKFAKMKCKIKYLTTFTFLTAMLPYMTHAQVQKNEIIIPANITANKFENCNIDKPNLYNGSIENDIPLYEIKLKNFSLPIILSHNYNGFRPGENSSWVGLGWDIRVGGSISRVVHNAPDDSPNGYDYINNELNIPDPVKESASYQQFITSLTKDQLRMFIEGMYDGQPDEFMLSGSNLNAKFIKLKDGKIVTIPYRPIEIQAKKDSWIVQDEAGNTYYYGAIEEVGNAVNEQMHSGTAVSSGDFSGYDYISKYMLVKITTLSGDDILFNYESENLSFPVSTSQTRSFYVETSSAGNPDNMLSPGGSTSRTTANRNGYRLVSIVTPKEQIYFNKGDLRKDLNSTDSYLLKKIEIKDKDNHLVKGWNFYSSYMGNPNKYSQCRLLLDSIAEFGKDKSKGKSPYRFQYETSSNIPEYETMGIDHWGYYNGKNNTTLVPSYIPNSSFNDRFTSFSTDRNPNHTYSRIGLLKSIQYPLGGTSSYIYEPNTYGYVDNDPIDDIVYRKESVNVNASATSSTVVKKDQFSLTNRQVVNITYFLNPNTASTGTEISVDQDPAYFKITKVGETSNKFYKVATMKNVSGTDSIPLDPGSYNVEIYANPNQLVYATIDYLVEKKDAAGNNIINKTITTAGHRLKQIILQDEDKTVNKYFGYQLAAEKDRSSGVLVGNPDYEYTQTVMNVSYSGAFPRQYSDLHMVSRTSNSVRPISSDDSHICYSEISEYGDADYKTVSYFTSSQNYPDYSFPRGATNISKAYKRGLLTRSVNLDKDSKLVSSIINNYDFDREDNKDGIAAIMLVEYLHQDISPSLSTYMYPWSGTILSEWIPLESMEQEKDGVKTKQSYYYDNPAHAQTTRSLTDTGNKAYCTFTLYPDDYASANANDFIGAMKSRHIISSPIEQIKCVKDTTSGALYVVGGEIYTYKTGNQAGLPESTYKMVVPKPVPLSSFKFSNRNSAGESPYGKVSPGSFSITNIDPLYSTVPETTILQYDPNNNVREIMNKDNIHICYLWWGGQYPVAEIKNMDYSTLENAIGKSLVQDIQLGADLENGKMDVVNSLRTNPLYKDALVSTYTYRPLVGMTSATAPNGVTTYYEYDAFNRLKRTYIIENGQQKTVQSYDYHYKQ